MAQIRTAITRAAQILSASAILGQLTWGRGHGATSQPRYAAALPRTRQSLEIRSDRPENRQQRRQSPLTHLAAVSARNSAEAFLGRLRLPQRGLRGRHGASLPIGATE